MTNENETDLYAELQKALSEEEPEVVEVVKVETPTETDTQPEEVVEPEVVTPEAEPEAPLEAAPESPKAEATDGFKNIKDFLDAVQDEPSRNLLKQFYGAIKSETAATLAPVERANNEAKFNSEFSKYEKIDGLSDYKNDLRKTFLRNPNQSVKALIGEVVTDLQLSKVKPIEKTPSSPSRDGKVDTSTMNLEQLYAYQDTLRG